MKVNGISDLFSTGNCKWLKIFLKLNYFFMVANFFFSFDMCSSTIPYYQDTVPINYFFSWD